MEILLGLWRWVSEDKMDRVTVMEPKMTQLPARRVYAVEIREDLDEFVNLWGHGIEFYHLLLEMSGAHDAKGGDHGAESGSE